MTRVLAYVEIDVPFCANIYGTAPCTASIPTTGAIKCFNSLKTCQDRVNYIDDPVTFRFAQDQGFLPAEIDCIPSVTGISFTPATVSLGKDLGTRASLSVTFKDHPWPDTGPGYDKYLADRPYDPFRLGTFWGKFRARQPFLRGRALRLIRGTVGQALADMETRHYVIDSFSHDASDGSYTLVAKDVLKLADDDRAQAPVLSQGFLNANITSSATSAVLQPSGIGDAEYPASGHVAIGGKEIAAFTRSGNTLTLTRAQLGTTAIAHEANDRVQLVLRYAAEDVADIIRDLLVNYAGVDDAHIPIAAWQTETASFLARVFSANIAEPVGVNKLVSELIEDAALSLWWDDVTPQLRLRVLRAIATDAATFDQGSYLEGSFSSTEQPNTRLSQIWRYFAKRNPLDGQDDADNYRSVAATVDLEAETDYGSSAIHKIYSRWIPFGGRTIADRANDLYLARFRDPPRKFNFATFRDGLTVPLLGQGYRIEGLGLQDETGAAASAPIQITRLNPGEARFEIEAEEMLVTAGAELDLINRVVVIDSNTLNVDLRALHDTLYPAPTDADVTAGVNLTCYVDAGVIVGSSSTAAAAFIVGTWPTDFLITLVVNGRIQGTGGQGGTNYGGNGFPGGPALYTRHAIDLEVATGEIFGGGGGGGGGGGHANCERITGSGGAGQLPGQPGTSLGGTPIYGNAGTTEAGGARVGSPLHNGAGGGPGLDGEHADLGSQGGSGGAAGAAIDGDSFVTVTVGPGDIRGPQIN